MHPGAHQFVAYLARCLPARRRVCQFGRREVDGSVRGLFPGAEYLGADFVGDAAMGEPTYLQRFDTIISTEALEHTPEGEMICVKAHNLLEDGGVFIVTAASVGRAPHSVIDDGPLRHGEFYRNVSPFLLRKWLRPFRLVMVDTANATDVYALAVR